MIYRIESFKNDLHFMPVNLEGKKHNYPECWCIPVIEFLGGIRFCYHRNEAMIIAASGIHIHKGPYYASDNCGCEMLPIKNELPTMKIVDAKNLKLPFAKRIRKDRQEYLHHVETLVCRLQDELVAFKRTEDTLASIQQYYAKKYVGCLEVEKCETTDGRII